MSPEITDQLVRLLTRDDDADAAPVVCDSGNEYDGRMGARISSIFVILICGTFGALFPVLCSKYSQIKVPPVFFFCAKYFGSGVIIATSLLHLLQPANEALSQECLGHWNDYPYAFGICLFMVFFMFAVELVCFNMFGHQGHSHGPVGLASSKDVEISGVHEHTHEGHSHDDHSSDDIVKENEKPREHSSVPVSMPNPIANHDPLTPKDHYGHCEEHTDPNDVDLENDMGLETYSAQLVSIFVLEFGIIFHSVFIGLTLAVSGDEFKDLYIVLVFHQMFEGFGLGTRLATAPWPKKKVWTPWILGLAFGLTTPIAIAIGLGVRKTYPPGGKTASITNGIFDSVSSGILLYTGLVELMAHEFLFSSEFKHANNWRIFWAFAWMCAGAGLMALLAKWA
ncbi:Zinc/iron permease [Yarrowia lipolytica]|jgi:zinc transporter 1/2/3|uniref:YALI0F21659p n=2 Tax=Yarrowia lipolytica TaxID=4952 RepID=Q6C0U6_YARLI|nr:YALI0F21659p [Yarrowia lipolytica CLIB122]AOW07526.1 hypothetical protein YALI1_F28590g [Yarrowia lipolytica]KAB8286581.1 Zinc/iron permease [Yarrowia lipolytica]KAE8173475.1 Zinc/iron permease [Yarrowia lipolytica]KAJ8055402.1 Zinc/iron permease [Yarrowia lipolytica]RDW28296.1 Zinc/iron permease [Yarrowia lipolytica]|eukprot:XP_505716.1 YALI0F21659p [Yarrowia lipolytica CLIB122]